MSRARRFGWALWAVPLLSAACSPSSPSGGNPRPTDAAADSGAGDGPHAEAGFVELAPRNVVLGGRAVSLAATSRIFYNFRPADQDPEGKPIIVLFNGFASDTVRPFGTGPFTVQLDGTVIPNPDSLTQFANLLYIDPRQSGFSYDLIASRAPADADCSRDVFNEYVDAADVLLASTHFVTEHHALTGPVYFMGESYAGVRITWMLSYLRQAYALAPYQDSALETAMNALDRARFLHGQILLEPWLAGAAHAVAISNACVAPALVAAVQTSVVMPCPVDNACACANYFSRSQYNYTITDAEQTARFFTGDSAQIDPAEAEAICGVKLETVPPLHAGERARGFKCSVADETTPSEAALVSLLGALRAGQNYNLAYSPLQPGKGTMNPDWHELNLVGAAFLDNLRTIDTFLTDGKRDLVVPEVALAPALTALGTGVSVTQTPDRVTVAFPAGPRNIDIRHYPDAGHMITMIEPHALSQDVRAWLALRGP